MFINTIYYLSLLHQKSTLYVNVSRKKKKQQKNTSITYAYVICIRRRQMIS